MCIWTMRLIHLMHLILLGKVFAALKQAGLKVHPGKCMLAQSKIRTLGFLLDEEGIHPDPLNLAKIEEWPIPVNVKQIKQYKQFRSGSLVII